jgi:hypothetical protein
VFPTFDGPVKRTLSLALLFALAFLSACRASRLRVISAPPEVRSLEGYGTVKLVREGASGRTRFSFVLEPGRRGKVEVLDALNRTAAEIFLAPDEAFFVLRSEKVYWKAAPGDVIEKFLGLALGLDDVAGLLRGRAPGRRAGLNLEVRETFPGGSVPRRIEFSGPTAEGTITILDLAFNVPVAEKAFDMDFLSTHSPRRWEEIERILRRED